MTPHSPSDTWAVLLVIGLVLSGLALTLLAVYSLLMTVGITAIRHIRKTSVALGICSAMVTVFAGAEVVMRLTNAEHPFGGLAIIVPIGLIVGLLSGAKMFGILKLTQEAHRWIKQQAKEQEQE